MFFRRSILRQFSNASLERHVASDGSVFMFNRVLNKSSWIIDEPEQSETFETKATASDDNSIQPKPASYVVPNSDYLAAKATMTNIGPSSISECALDSFIPNSIAAASLYSAVKQFSQSELGITRHKLESYASTEVAKKLRYHIQSNPQGSIVQNALQAIDHFVTCLDPKRTCTFTADQFAAATMQLEKTWKFFNSSKRTVKPEALITWIAALADAQALLKNLPKPDEVALAVARAAEEWQAQVDPLDERFRARAAQAYAKYMQAEVPKTLVITKRDSGNSADVAESRSAPAIGELGMIGRDFEMRLKEIERSTASLTGEAKSLTSRMFKLESQIARLTESAPVESYVAGDGSSFIYDKDSGVSSWKPLSDDWETIKTPEGVSFFYSRANKMSVWTLP